MTNKPEVAMTLLGGEQLVRLSDYEVLQSDRDQQYDMKVKAREQRDAVTAKLNALQAECEKLVEALEFIAKSVHPQGNGPGVVIRNVDGRDWRNWLETAEQLLAAHRKGGQP